MRSDVARTTKFALFLVAGILLLNNRCFGQLTVDRGSGALTFGLSESAEVKGYSIASDNGLLSAEAWSSLTDQGIEGWIEANPRNQLLSELNPYGFTDPAAGQLALGNAYVGTTSGLSQEDLAFQYILSDGSLVNGDVHYTGAINDFVLRVDPDTGAANLELMSANVGPFDVIGYSIFSDSGSLAVGNLSGLGEGWTAAPQTANAISELSYEGSMNFTTNTTAPIGNIFTPGGEQDLRIQFATATELLDGSVTYGPGGGGTDPTCEEIAAMRIPGDANGNNEVEFTDFLAVANNFDMPGGYDDGDFDCSGRVEFLDFLILANNFGSTGAASAAAVPEPSTGPLAILAALMLAGVFRKRLSSAACLCAIGMTVLACSGSNSAMAVDFTSRIVVLDAANPGANATIDSSLEARGILNGTVTDVNIAEDVSGTVDFIDFAGGGGAYSNFDYPYPNGVNDATQNDFAVQVTGFLEIPEGTWYIGLNSDDGGIITMPRVNFTTTVNENGATGAAGEIIFNAPRGAGTFTYGEFTVPAGGIRTEFEAIMFERGGGDSLEVAVLDDEFPIESNEDWASFGIELGDGTYDWKVLETGPSSGDFNWDDTVDFNDFLVLAANFGTGTSFAQGDNNGDSRVDLVDFGQLFPLLPPAAAAASSVPEPNSLSLLSLASLSLLLTRRRRRLCSATV